MEHIYAIEHAHAEHKKGYFSMTPEIDHLSF